MYRYDSAGYRGRRRRSHTLRNTVMAVLALLIAGAVFASTGAGARVLSAVGLRGEERPAAVARDGTASAGRADEPISEQPGAEAGDEEATATQDTPEDGDPPIAGNTQAPAPNGAGAKPTPALPAEPSISPFRTAQLYLAHWETGKFEEMFKLLSKSAQRKYDRKYFVERYKAINERATTVSVQARLGAQAAEIAKRDELLLSLPFTATTKTNVVGDITENNVLPLVKEQNVWRVQWEPTLIFKDLEGTNRLGVPAVYPGARGTILDRKGRPLALDGEIAQIGVIPGRIENEPQLLDRVGSALGVGKQFVKDTYKDTPNPAWFVPIRTLTKERAASLEKQLGDIPGLTFQATAGRVYPYGTTLAQTLGYVQSITAEDIAKPEYEDYPDTAIIGKTGIELWGEPYLRGQSGGKLEIVSEDGAPLKTLKERFAKPGNNIYLNIDVTFQQQAERDLAVRGEGGTQLRGAVVALDPKNGEILALASQPSYDLNKFVVGISAAEYGELEGPEGGNPFNNRTVSSAYPMASAFKPITASAAFAAGLPDVNRTWYSDGTWEGLGPSEVRRDWKPGGHGYVNLYDGITESVDTVFYDLGLELAKYRPNFLTEHAKRWHLGKPYGVEGVPAGLEAAGLVPGPGNPNPYWSYGNNVNLSIGQGELTVSPLQAANVYATIGNGGTIWKPRLIRRIVSGENSRKVIKEYPPLVVGKAPATPGTIEFLQRALLSVTTAENGTATDKFEGFPVPVAGKTGTGQQDKLLPYAWFAAYAPADNPKVTVVMVAENAGEGSAIAAPVVRKVIGQYLKVPVARP